MVNYISCLVACKIVFYSKFSNIQDNAGKVTRRTRRRTQAIAKHYAFHANAKNGKYTIQELIVPRKFIKTTLFGNCIENEEMEISGQKIDITYIWKKLLEKKKKNSRQKDLTKYLITWTGKVLLRIYKSSMRFKVVV